MFRYGPTSNENIVENLSKITIEEIDFAKFKEENERLKTRLERTQKEIRSKREQIESLKHELVEAKSTVAQENQKETQDSAEELCSHFGEVVRRYHDTLRQRDQRIQELSRRLADHRCHPRVQDERLRRTGAAVRVFQGDLGVVRTQLRNCPLREDKLPCSTSREKVTVAELRRRQRFRVVADLERMAHTFFQRLKFEEKLDKLHWKIETERLERHKRETGGDCEPGCCYDEEFEVLATTRNTLLRALGDLRARTGDTESADTGVRGEAADTEVRGEAGLHITTLQSLYRPSSFTLRASPSDNEYPDK